MILLLLALPAQASSVGFGVNLVAEALRDTSLTQVYGSTALGAEGHLSTPLPFYHLEVAASFGYHRMGGNEIDELGNTTSVPTWLWFAPVSATVGPHIELGHWNLGAAVGPSFVLWSEQPGALASRGYHGGKIGALFEGSARAEVGKTQAPLYDPTRPSATFSVEGSIGWRWTYRPPGEPCGGAPCGLDFSALRLGLGVIAVF